MLKNITEYLVKEKMDSLMKSKEYAGCQCERCREDIMAYTLNRLPPKYASSTTGELFTKVAAQSAENEFEILRELAMAMKAVGEKPSHK